MAQIIALKRSVVPDKKPDIGSLNLGEIAINTYDGKAFMKRSGSIYSIEEFIITNAVNTGSITLTETGSFGELVVTQDANISRDLYVTRDIVSNGDIDAAGDISGSGLYIIDTIRIEHNSTQLSGSVGITGSLLLNGIPVGTSYQIQDPTANTIVLANTGSMEVIIGGTTYMSVNPSASFYGVGNYDSHTFTGSVWISGSLLVNGQIVGGGGTANTFDFNLEPDVSGKINFIEDITGTSNVTTNESAVTIAVGGQLAAYITPVSFDIPLSLTASLQQGYVLVGNGSNKTIAVSTSSFGGGIAELPPGVVSSSVQVLGGSGVWSGSAQLPLGVVSGSTQIDYGGIFGIPSGIISSSAQLPSGLISSSAQLPSGIISSSSQLTASYDSRYSLSASVATIDSTQNIRLTALESLTGSYATTGSNTFNGNQTITGSLTVSSVAVVSASVTLPSGSILSLTSGSSLLIQNSGYLEITGSLIQSGSLTSYGPNALIGATTLTGSLLVSGSSTLTGSLSISSGSITMPNRPALRVTGAGGAKVATTPLTGSYLNVDYQQGNVWDAATGTFTAPIAGLYMVTLVVRTNSNSLGSISQLIVYKNNTGGTTGTAQVMVEFGTNTSMNHTGGSTISKLAVGDTLKMVVASGEISFDQNDNFSVAYIG